MIDIQRDHDRDSNAQATPLPFRLTRIETVDDDDDDDDADEGQVAASYLLRLLGGTRARSVRRQARPLPEFLKPHTEPQPAGTRLLFGGEFGRVKVKLDARDARRNIARRVLARGKHFRYSPKEDLAHVSKSLVHKNDSTVSFSIGSCSKHQWKCRRGRRFKHLLRSVLCR
jgi:hypothetical protein